MGHWCFQTKNKTHNYVLRFFIRTSTAGKNSGSFTIQKRALDPKKKASGFGDFEGAYSKEIDFRTFEYLIKPNLLIVDKFDFAKKNFANLLPVKKNCSIYLERFPVLFEL